MANVVVTLKIMPASPESDLKKIQEEAKRIITKQGGEVGREEIEAVAFGLKAVKLIFVRDEARGGTDEIERELSELESVASAEVIDVRRAIG
ncbi:MAG TPA: elongation factor 1-beta [Candidatus Nanoarchaeia archaeon]|nr:elongation factor 1-beta [Candidatus Nanoarchaeia archaeon]